MFCPSTQGLNREDLWPVWLVNQVVQSRESKIEQTFQQEAPVIYGGTRHVCACGQPARLALGHCHVADPETGKFVGLVQTDILDRINTLKPCACSAHEWHATVKDAA
jgi:hypothetical protein